MCKVMEVTRKIDIVCPQCGYKFNVTPKEIQHNIFNGEAFVSCRNPKKGMCNGAMRPICACYITIGKK